MNRDHRHKAGDDTGLVLGSGSRKHSAKLDKCACWRHPHAVSTLLIQGSQTRMSSLSVKTTSKTTSTTAKAVVIKRAR
jgi:hypothetical protein